VGVLKKIRLHTGMQGGQILSNRDGKYNSKFHKYYSCDTKQLLLIFVTIISQQQYALYHGMIVTRLTSTSTFASHDCMPGVSSTVAVIKQNTINHTIFYTMNDCFNIKTETDTVRFSCIRYLSAQDKFDGPRH